MYRLIPHVEEPVCCCPMTLNLLFPSLCVPSDGRQWTFLQSSILGKDTMLWFLRTERWLHLKAHIASERKLSAPQNFLLATNCYKPLWGTHFRNSLRTIFQKYTETFLSVLGGFIFQLSEFSIWSDVLTCHCTSTNVIIKQHWNNFCDRFE